MYDIWTQWLSSAGINTGSAVVILWLALAAAPVSYGQTSVTQDTAGSIIERILANSDEDPAVQLQNANKAMQLLQAEGSTDTLLLAKACLAISTASYISGDPRLAMENLRPCVRPELNQLDPSTYVRMRSSLAGMMLVNGLRKESLVEYKALLSSDTKTIDASVLRGVRSNYAMVLTELGQVVPAIEEMQDLLQQSIEAGDIDLVAAVGSNLITVLIDQRLYDSGAAWLERLAVPMRGMEDHHLSVYLRLIKMHLSALRGEPDAAVSQLDAFIRNSSAEQIGAINLSSAYEFYAQALLKAGRLEQALAPAKKAVELIANIPLEVSDARLVLAEAHVANAQFSQALVELDLVDKEAMDTPVRTEEAQTIRLIAELGQSGQSEIRQQFEQYLLVNRAREAAAILQSTNYFDARLTAQRQRTEIRRIEQSQHLLTARTAASEARASAFEVRANADRRIRNLVMGLAFLLTLSVVLVIYGWTRRRFEQRLRNQEKALNHQLSLLVDEKTAALQQRMNEQTDLERKLAKKHQAEAIGRLTGNVAHDFNNLLQVISIANEQIQDSVKSELSTSMLNNSNRALGHAKSIIRQLLAYARRQQLETAPIRFSDYLATTQALMTAAVGGKVVLEIIDESQGAPVKLDTGQLTTVLLNLLTNACDAMLDGGEVRLQARRQNFGAGEINFQDLEPGDYLLISVSDNGQGMSERERAQACEPFFTTKDEHSGTGLGLSSVYGFVRQSNGDMHIESAPDAGTCVSIAFPLTDESVDETESVKAPRKNISGLRLLLIEDNAVLARTLTGMIQHLGAAVVHCDNGDAALETIENDSHFDVVLSDIRMPGRHDGYALHRWLNKNYPTIPVLLMSGFKEAADIADEFTVIGKPFGMEELLEALYSTINSLPESY